MSTRKKKIAPLPPSESHSASSMDRSEPPNLSLIDRAAFMEGLQSTNGNALHSTALEEDLERVEAEQMHKGKAARKENPRKGKVTEKQHGAPGKKKKKTVTETGEEKKSVRRSTGEKVTARFERGGTAERKRSRDDVSPESDSSNMSGQPAPKTSRPTPAAGRRRRSSGRTSPVRPRKEQQTISKKTPESDETSSEVASQCPSRKKRGVFNSGRSRKSLTVGPKPRDRSAGSTSTEAEGSPTREERSKRAGRQATTDLEVALDAFQEFCDEYKETVASQVVKLAVDAFYSNVEDQILEKVTTDKELRVLRRDNAKLASVMRTKTQRLLGAKYELMRAERKVSLLQKEETDLKRRLDDLRRGNAFLRDLRGLNQQYLQRRRKHPEEEEKYGASSLPALQLEAKHIRTAEHQLKTINDKMEKRLGEYDKPDI